MRTGRLPPIDELNRMDADDFQAALAPLFEAAPRFLARLATERPFDSYAALLHRGEHVALELPEEEQLELINGHPRIGADPAKVSPLSFREQGYDGEPGTGTLQQRLDRLNEEYERRFGFRFVVFVAGRPRAEIADLMERHLHAQRDAERQRALRDVFAIARDRLSRLDVQEDG